MTDGELQRYLDLDEDDLYAELGAALSGGRGFGASDDERLRRQGERWFQSHLREIREKICPRSRALYAGDGVTDTSALIDAVAGLAGHPIPTIVAALSIKYGLKSLCRGYENDDATDQ